jgi:hypothetical protein
MGEIPVRPFGSRRTPEAELVAAGAAEAELAAAGAAEAELAAAGAAGDWVSSANARGVQPMTRAKAIARESRRATSAMQ